MEFYDNYLKQAELLVNKIMISRWAMFVNLNDTNKKIFVRIFKGPFWQKNLSYDFFNRKI